MPLIQATTDHIGLRVDKLLCQKFDVSFGIAQKLIREKKVKVNGKRVDAAYKIADGDQVEIFHELEIRTDKPRTKPKISDEKIKKFLSLIIYQDENMVAINKPSGLATQGGSGIEISVDDLLPALKKLNPQNNAQLVHRLDKDTSGILLIALNKPTAEFLTKCFKEKTIKKTYLAAVLGDVKKTEGEIKIPLRKKFVNKNEKVYPDFDEGKEAITHYKVIKKSPARFASKDIDAEKKSLYTLLELNPITGRTHQLRVHCKEIGHPIINDIKYGGLKVASKTLSKNLCLHAYKIEINDYFGKKLAIKADLPEFVNKISKAR